MDRLIPTKELQPGMVIVRVTRQNGPVKIKKSGLVSSMDMVRGLVEMGIQEVEIDPEQTVEVEAPKVKKSATHQMLESNTRSNTRIDDELSDQFHRSLFLPSVQDIPSAWQFYAKRYLLAAFVAAGGFACGWVLAHYPELKNSLFSPQVSKLAPPPAVAVEQNVETISELDSSAPVTEEVPETNPGVAEQVLEPNILLEPENNIASEDKLEELQEAAPVSQPSATNSLENAEPISADLLARFREAVSQVGDEPVEPDGEFDQSASDNDVPRIDQLPAWVLTELPSMAFSAHMYASNDSERWVRVNGSRMVEGDMIDGKVQILEITPQRVILTYQGHEFSMAALTDW